jgi:hypothetical protein
MAAWVMWLIIGIHIYLLARIVDVLSDIEHHLRGPSSTDFLN